MFTMIVGFLSLTTCVVVSQSLKFVARWQANEEGFPRERAAIAEKRRLFERDRVEWFGTLKRCKTRDEASYVTEKIRRLDEKLLELANEEARLGKDR